MAGIESGNESLSQIVVDALADVIGTDPTTLTPPLYEVVDPEAVDRLCTADGPVTVRFEYDGHTVAVHSDRSVVVDGIVYEPTGTAVS